MPWKILVIDDDEKLNRLLKRFLGEFDFTVYTASDAAEGLKKVRTVSPDLIILDLMLPGMSGFDVCKRIRQTSTLPIIMLTARGDLMDKVVGLELGADDYLPKPFEPRELVATNSGGATTDKGHRNGPLPKLRAFEYRLSSSASHEGQCPHPFDHQRICRSRSTGPACRQSAGP